MFSVRVVWRAPTSFLRRGSHREGNTNLLHSTKRNLGNYVEICTDVVALGIHFQKSAKWVTNPNLAYSMDHQESMLAIAHLIHTLNVYLNSCALAYNEIPRPTHNIMQPLRANFYRANIHSFMLTSTPRVKSTVCIKPRKMLMLHSSHSSSKALHRAMQSTKREAIKNYRLVAAEADTYQLRPPLCAMQGKPAL